MSLPQALVFLAIEPKTGADQERLSQALQSLTAEDAALCVEKDARTGQTIIRGMGDVHLEMIVDRLEREFDVPVVIGKPQVVYKEVLTWPAEGEGRYVRQIGGRDHYAHVRIRLLPGESGSGYIFENQISDGAIPDEFIKPIDEGIQEELARGVLAGYPVDDVWIELYDGSYHDIDSSEMAFRIAGAMAFQDAGKRAGPVLVEPVMRVEVVADAMHMSEVLRDLVRRRGRIDSQEDGGGMCRISARVPIAEMLGYASDLRAQTGGRASYSMRFDRYEPVDPGSDHVGAR